MNPTSNDPRTNDPTPNAPVLECRHLTKRYGERTVVSGVGFTIAPGETYGLLGPNGAGKTTTISMLCGLLRADEGTVTVNGVDFDADPLAAKRSIGYVPQDIALYPDLSATENLRFFGQLYGLRRKTLQRRVDVVLDVVGLADRAQERIDTYSGGMKRRLNIAAGLLHEPQLLVLDEPTVGVDPQSRNAILEAVGALGRQGLAVLYTTHYMEEAQRLCDRIGILDQGMLVAEGTQRQLVTMVGERDRVQISATGDLDPLIDALRTLDGVHSISGTDGTLELLVDSARRSLPRIVELADHLHLGVSSVEVDEPDLESVFLHLTGRALRD